MAKKFVKTQTVKKNTDPTFRIVEMKDGLEEAIKSLDKTITSQNELIVFLKTEPNGKFNDTVTELIVQNENLKMKKEDYEKRLADITTLLDSTKENEEKKDLLILVLKALFNN